MIILADQIHATHTNASQAMYVIYWITAHRIDNYKLYFFLADAVERDNFLSPNEAKEFGLIDHVLTWDNN